MYFAGAKLSVNLILLYALYGFVIAFFVSVDMLNKLTYFFIHKVIVFKIEKCHIPMNFTG